MKKKVSAEWRIYFKFMSIFMIWGCWKRPKGLTQMYALVIQSIVGHLFKAVTASIIAYYHNLEIKGSQIKF